MPCSSPLSTALALVLLAAPIEAQEPAIDARLSPGGQVVAFRALEDATPRIFVRGALDSLAAPAPVTPPGMAVDTYAWAPDGGHIVFRAEGDGSLYVTAADTSADPASPRELTPDTRGPVRLAGFADEPLAALVEVPGRWPEAPDLVRVDLRTATTTRVAENDGSMARWVPDDTGEPRLGLRPGEDGETEVVRQRGDVYVPIFRCEAGGICEPAGFHPDGRVWLRASRGDDAPRLLLLDPLTSEQETVRPDLSDDPGAAFRSDSTFQADVARLRERLGDARLTFHPPTADGSRMLVVARNAEEPAVYLYDRWSGVVARILALDADPAAALASAISSPNPEPAALRPIRLGYRVTDDDPMIAPIDVDRRIEQRTEGDRRVWRVVDSAEVPTYGAMDVDDTALPDDMDDMDDVEGFPEPEGRTEAGDTVVIDAASLAPLSRRAGGPLTIRLDFHDDRVVGTMESEGFQTPVELQQDDPDRDGPIWADGPALEMLVAALPLEHGYATRLTLFDTRALQLAMVDLTVEGEERVTTEAGTFDAWRVVITSDLAADNREEWLVRTAAPHYLIRSTLRTGASVRTIQLTDAGGLQ